VEFAKEGAFVIIHGLNPEKLDVSEKEGKEGKFNRYTQ
jgi:hypothetical protein